MARPLRTHPMRLNIFSYCDAMVRIALVELVVLRERPGVHEQLYADML
jgi:hypothetical protein